MEREKLISALAANGGKGQVFAGGSYLFGNKLLTSDGNVVDLGKIRSCRVYANGWYLLQKAQGAFLYDGKGKTVFQGACVSAVKVFANGWYFIKSGKDGILFRGKNKPLDFSVCDAEVYANGWYKLRDGKSWKLWNAKGDSVSSGLLDAGVLNNGWYWVKSSKVCTLYRADGSIAASAKNICANQQVYYVDAGVVRYVYNYQNKMLAKVRSAMIYDAEGNILAENVQAVRVTKYNLWKIKTPKGWLFFDAEGKAMTFHLSAEFENGWYCMDERLYSYKDRNPQKYLVTSRGQKIAYSGRLKLSVLNGAFCLAENNGCFFVLRNNARIGLMVSELIALIDKQKRISETEAAYYNLYLNFLGCRDYVVNPRA